MPNALNSVDQFAGMSAPQIAQMLVSQLGKSQPMPLRAQDSLLLQDAEQIVFGPDFSRVAWSIGEGPLVLLVHGWGGRGVQMAAMAHALAAKGHRCIMFDAGGHGDSGPAVIGFDTFIADTAALAEFVGGEVFAWIGHSAGGLGMMAARSLRGLKARHYVCIATPLFPYVPIETLRQNFAVGDDVLDHIKPVLAAQFESDWGRLAGGSAYRPDGGRLMLAYDRDDPRVAHGDLDVISALWTDARTLKTSGLGHNKILQSPDVIDWIVDNLIGG